MKNYPGKSVSELWRRLQHSSMDGIRASVRSSLALTAEQSANLRAHFGVQMPPVEEDERELRALALELAIMKRRR